MLNRIQEVNRQRGLGRPLMYWLLAWTLSRAMLLLDWEWANRPDTGDVAYYYSSIQSWLQGAPMPMPEYPVPAMWLLRTIFSFGSEPVTTFAAVMMTLDLAFMLMLWFFSGQRKHAAMATWLVFVPLLGPINYLRFDMIPTFLVGAALLLLSRAPHASGLLVGAGAAVKLWPALLVLPLLARRDKSLKVIVGFAVAGVGLAFSSLLGAGWMRTVSPLKYQADRGLQIESVPATGLMVLRALGAGNWSVELSPYKAFEIFGPGVATSLGAVQFLTLLGLLTIVTLAVSVLRNPDPSPLLEAAFALVIVVILIATNKTLSPQYIVWLGAPAAVMVSYRPKGGRCNWIPVVIPLWLLAMLTQMVYPMWYGEIVSNQLRGVLILTVRNTLLVGTTVIAIAWMWRTLAHSRHPMGTTVDN